MVCSSDDDLMQNGLNVDATHTPCDFPINWEFLEVTLAQKNKWCDTGNTIQPETQNASISI